MLLKFELKQYIALITMCAMTLCLLPMPTVQAALSEVPFEPKDCVVNVWATVTESPAPAITVNWEEVRTSTNDWVDYYNVARKEKNAVSWGADTRVEKDTFFYTDTNVAVGQTYEYRVRAVHSTVGWFEGYVLAGIKVAEVPKRGTAIIILEKERLGANDPGGLLADALEQFCDDLIGDGWGVIRHDVSRSDSAESVKALIKKDYDADPDNVEAVILLGRIPIYMSGNYNIDSHGNRAYSAEAYYGEMGNNEAAWSAKPNAIPGTVKLQVGRVDFEGINKFKNGDGSVKTHTELLIQYLNKDHKYRMGLTPTTKDALVIDYFKNARIGAPASVLFRAMYPLWGANPRYDYVDNDPNTSANPRWQQFLENDTYTWGHVNANGADDKIFTYYGEFSTDFISDPSKRIGMVFATTLASYQSDWWKSNHITRSIIAVPDYGLTANFSSWPQWFYHPMGLGETIGNSARLTQNNKGSEPLLYNALGNPYPGYVHIALMGDPTLRMYPILPAANLTLTQSSGNTVLNWTASADSAVTEYCIYGSEYKDGEYELLASVSGTTWTHNNPGEIKNYMVRARKLQETGSGSFYNLAQGAMAGDGELKPPPDDVECVAITALYKNGKLVTLATEEQMLSSVAHPKITMPADFEPGAGWVIKEFVWNNMIEMKPLRVSKPYEPTMPSADDAKITRFQYTPYAGTGEMARKTMAGWNANDAGAVIYNVQLPSGTTRVQLNAVAATAATSLTLGSANGSGSPLAIDQSVAIGAGVTTVVVESKGTTAGAMNRYTVNFTAARKGLFAWDEIASEADALNANIQNPGSNQLVWGGMFMAEDFEPADFKDQQYRADFNGSRWARDGFAHGWINNIKNGGPAWTETTGNRWNMYQAGVPWNLNTVIGQTNSAGHLARVNRWGTESEPNGLMELGYRPDEVGNLALKIAPDFAETKTGHRNFFLDEFAPASPPSAGTLSRGARAMYTGTFVVSQDAGAGGVSFFPAVQGFNMRYQARMFLVSNDGTIYLYGAEPGGTADIAANAQSTTAIAKWAKDQPIDFEVGIRQVNPAYTANQVGGQIQYTVTLSGPGLRGLDGNAASAGYITQTSGVINIRTTLTNMFSVGGAVTADAPKDAAIYVDNIGVYELNTTKSDFSAKTAPWLPNRY